VKAQSILRTTALVSILAGLGLSAPASSHHRSAASDAAMTYVSPAFNNAIYGYPNIKGTVQTIAAPRLVYVDQAYGQAIYSYLRVGTDKASALRPIYVDPAWGQAIYSYPRAMERPATVEVLPLMVE
jgi:hypothetical protein